MLGSAVGAVISASGLPSVFSGTVDFLGRAVFTTGEVVGTNQPSVPARAVRPFRVGPDDARRYALINARAPQIVEEIGAPLQIGAEPLPIPRTLLASIAVPSLGAPLTSDNVAVPRAVESPERRPAGSATDLLAANLRFEAPRRLGDGSIFVPKSIQRLLDVQTVTAREVAVGRPSRLNGHVVPDPNGFGRVQAPVAGRIEPTENGLPSLGRHVERGQLLAYIAPIVGAAEMNAVNTQIAQLSSEIDILERRLARLDEVTFVPFRRGKVEQGQLELRGLRQQRSVLQSLQSARVPIRAPASGIVSDVRVVAGEIVDPREPLFDIVQPGRFFVEARTTDAELGGSILAAAAVTSAGETIRLSYVGSGRALRNQMSPLQFAVLDPVPSNLSIGTPITVFAESGERIRGILLPTEAVLRPEGGVAVVLEHISAERFMPRPVTIDRVGGDAVIVTGGLRPGMRVVARGALALGQTQ
jgi:hypothetical protein